MVSDRSNGSNWRSGIATKIGFVIVLAIAVAAIGWGWNYGLLQERTYEQEARQAHANQSKNSCYQIAKAEVQSPSVKKPDSKPCTPDEKAQQENDNRRDYADLVAQRSSALWAKIMGIAALIGMGLSAIGVVLIWTTFRETSKATKSTQINSEAYIWNERAWLEFTDWSWATANIRTTPIDAFPMVTIHNSGKSVAKIVRAASHEVDSGWKKIGCQTEWPVIGRLIKAGSTETLRAFPINLDASVKKQFIVDVEYMILGGETDAFECRFAMSLIRSNSSIGGFELEYSR